MRKNEVFEMRWENVDLNKKTLLIPKTKNGEPLLLPMSDCLFDLFAHRKDDAGSSSWIFPSDGKKGHLIDVRKALLQVEKKTDVKIMVHDLRRTFATIAESLGISSHTLKELLNHKTDNDVTSGYIVRDVERLRKPAQQIAERMLSLIKT
jgi:integrase